MTDKKIAIQFTVVTFIIAYATAGALIFLVSLVIESITLQIHLDNLPQTSLCHIYFVAGDCILFCTKEKQTNYQLQRMAEKRILCKRQYLSLFICYVRIGDLFWHTPCCFGTRINRVSALCVFTFFAWQSYYRRFRGIRLDVYIAANA